MITATAISENQRVHLKEYLETGKCAEILELSPPNANDIVNNEWIQALWVYWCEFRDRPISKGKWGRLAWVKVGDHSYFPAVAKKHLEELLLALMTSADSRSGYLEIQAEKAKDAYSDILASPAGSHQLAVDHLKIAALYLGYDSDHFIRRAGPDRIIRFAHETEEEYEIRRLAVLNYPFVHIHRPGFPKSLKKGKSMQKDTYMIRFIWPKMSVSVAHAKNIHPTPWKAISELVGLYDPDGGPSPDTIRLTVKKIENL